jgi:hypothetical protein
MADETVTKTMVEAAIALERQRCIDRVLTYAAIRDRAAITLDRAMNGNDDEKPSEGAAERARMQAEVARDIACFLSEEVRPGHQRGQASGATLPTSLARANS